VVESIELARASTLDAVEWPIAERSGIESATLSQVARVAGRMTGSV